MSVIRHILLVSGIVSCFCDVSFSENVLLSLLYLGVVVGSVLDVLVCK